MHEFESVRPKIEHRISGSGVVDSWRFESHAVAAGTRPEAQYLEYARNCDLFVLIIGSEESSATFAEYNEAFQDNPRKILPFFLGKSSKAVHEFRTLIDSRHTRVATRSPEDLVSRIGTAVDEAVTTGTPIIRDVAESTRRRLAQLNHLVDSRIKQTFVPLVEESGTQVRRSERLAASAERYGQIVLEGPGGSGKTFATLTQIFLWTNDPEKQRLGLFLRATPSSHTLPGLLTEAFDALRFSPGDQLLDRYGREGRLNLVCDGYDELSDEDRLRYVGSVQQFANRFPRCPIVFVSRRLPKDFLTSFQRFTMTPLSEEMVVGFLASQGYADLNYWNIPAEVRDLACWPLWIELLAKFGTDIDSGLSLLQKLVNFRLSKQSPVEGRRIKVKEALGQIALAARPAVTISRDKATSQLSEWMQETSVMARFRSEPSETLIEDGLATGLIEAEGESLVFIHPLLATLLAAEAAALEPTLPVQIGADQDLSAFLVPLLPETRANDIVAILGSHNIFVLARTLRLARRTPRSNPIDADLLRFDYAFEHLAHLAGKNEAARCHEETTSIIHGDQWMALTRRAGQEPELVDGKHFAAWANPKNGRSRDFVLWDINPLNSIAPELLAAAEILGRFKQNFKALKPSGDPFDRVEDDELQELLGNPRKLKQLTIRFVTEMNDAKRRLAEESGLSNCTGVTIGEAQPDITVYLHGANSRVKVTWGHTKLRYEARQEDPDFEGYSLGSVWAEDVLAIAYHDLQREVEQELGSSIDSQAWQKPHLLAEWTW